jgi:hypothetical protein
MTFHRINIKVRQLELSLHHVVYFNAREICYRHSKQPDIEVSAISAYAAVVNIFLLPNVIGLGFLYILVYSYRDLVSYTLLLA